MRTGRPRTFEIVQLQTRALMLFEDDHMWREIQMDGRSFPDVPLGRYVVLATRDGFADVCPTPYISRPHLSRRPTIWLVDVGAPSNEAPKITPADEDSVASPSIALTR